MEELIQKILSNTEKLGWHNVFAHDAALEIVTDEMRWYALLSEGYLEDNGELTKFLAERVRVYAQLSDKLVKKLGAQ